jgi:membrane protease subunit HflK
VLDEYKKAPDVTRQRLYLETMERVLGGADKIILDSKAASGVVPYLPLDQLQRSKPPGAK